MRRRRKTGDYRTSDAGTGPRPWLNHAESDRIATVHQPSSDANSLHLFSHPRRVGPYGARKTVLIEYLSIADHQLLKNATTVLLGHTVPHREHYKRLSTSPIQRAHCALIRRSGCE